MRNVPLGTRSWARDAQSIATERNSTSPPALTILELLIAGAIVATLVGIGFPAYNKYRENAKVAAAIVDVRTMEHDILIHEGFAHRWPDSLNEIGRGGYLDPWNRPYQYLSSNSVNWAGERRRDLSDNPLNDDFDLYSLGRDGLSKPQLKFKESQDDVVRAQEGTYVGLAWEY